MQLLSIESHGIAVSTWNGTTQGWAAKFATPSAMANSTETGDSKLFGRVALTAQGNAFAVTLDEAGTEAPQIQQWTSDGEDGSWGRTWGIEAWKEGVDGGS
jgi:hypothetical protein